MLVGRGNSGDDACDVVPQMWDFFGIFVAQKLRALPPAAVSAPSRPGAG
jgi:hypothetical protein